MKEELDDIYLGQPEPARGTLLALRGIILDHDPHISETVKYGMPCFLYGRNIFCYLWMDKSTGEPYILMAEGNHMHNPHLEQGSRSRMKILRIDPGKDIPVDAVAAVLDEGIALYKRGVVRLKG